MHLKKIIKDIMSSVLKIIKHGVKIFIKPIYILVFAFFIAILVIKLASPLLAYYRVPMTRYLSQTLNIPLEIDNISLKIKGITPTLALKDIKTQFSLGPNFNVSIQEVNVQLNLLDSLISFSPQFNYILADGIILDVILSTPKLDPREVIYQVFSNLPKLKQGAIKNINISIYNHIKSDNSLIIQLPKLTALLNSHESSAKQKLNQQFNQPKYALELSLDSSNSHARPDIKNMSTYSLLSAKWDKPEQVKLYLNLNEFSPTSTSKWKLDAQIWGDFIQKELRFAHGSGAAHLAENSLEHIPFDITIWGGDEGFEKEKAKKDNTKKEKIEKNYQAAIILPFSRIDAVLKNNMFTAQSQLIDLKKLNQYKSLVTSDVFPAQGMLKDMMINGVVNPFSYNLQLDAQRLYVDVPLKDKHLILEDLDFKLSASQNGAELLSHIKLFEQSATVSGDFFKTPFKQVKLNGDIFFQKHQDGISAQDQRVPKLLWKISPELRITHDQVDAMVSGFMGNKYQINAQQDQRSNLSLYTDVIVNIQPIDIREVKRYLPEAFLPKSINYWLNNALDQGQVTGISTLTLSGHLSEFMTGFTKKINNQISGVFNVDFSVKNANLSYLPQFPELSQITGDINFHNLGMNIKGNANILNDVRTQNVSLTIKDFRRSLLEIRGELNATLPQYQIYLQQVKLLAPIYNILKDFQLKSRVKNVNNPSIFLAIDAPLKVDNAEFHAANIHEKVSVKGRVNVKNLDLLYMPLKLNLNKINGNFLFTEQGLANGDPITFTVLDAPANLYISRNKTFTEFRVHTKNKLTPYIKQFVPLFVSSVQDSGSTNIRSKLLVPHLNSLTSWQFTAESDLSGLQINAPYDLGKLEHTQRQLSVKIAPEVSKNQKIKSLIAKRILVNLNNDFSFNGLISDRLQDFSVSINTLHADGNIDYEDGGLLRAQFKTLVLPDEWRLSKNIANLKAHARGANHELVKISDMPDIDVEINQLYRSNILLGELLIKGTKSLNLWALNHISLTSDDLIISGSVLWETNMSPSRHNTQIKMNIATKTAHAFNQFSGFDLGLTGISQADFYIESPSSLANIDIKKISGNFKINMREGSITASGDEYLKIMSTFNISTFFRRLSLNFKDLYGDDLNYDVFNILGAIKSGIISVEKGILKASSIDLRASGLVDLKNDKYALDIKIIPKVSSIVPIIGTAAGGPVVGGGLLILERLLNNEIDEVSAQYYQITGRLLDPIFKKK